MEFFSHCISHRPFQSAKQYEASVMWGVGMTNMNAKTESQLAAGVHGLSVWFLKYLLQSGLKHKQRMR